MEKILPIVYNTEVNSVCLDIYRLSAILANDRYLPWFYEKYINLHMTPDLYIYFYDFGYTEHISIYDEVLEYKEIIDYNRENTIAKIKQAIDSNGYVLVLLDVYFVDGSSYYNSEHSFHDALLYGYDDQTQELNLIDMTNTLNPRGIIKLGYKQFCDALLSGTQMMKAIMEKGRSETDSHHIPHYLAHNVPASVFYLKEFNRKPDLSRIYIDLKACLNGGKSIDMAAQAAGEKLVYERHGITIYEGIYNDLQNILLYENPYYLNDKTMFIRGLKRLIENKTLLKKRIEYLGSQGLILHSTGVRNGLDMLCEKVSAAFGLIIKYNLSNDKKLLTQAMYLYKNCEELEISLLGDILDLLVKSMSKNTYFPA